MASIVLNNLKKPITISPDYTYLDVHLDMQQNIIPSKNGRDAVIGKDIKVDYDEAAIRNSILNIFNTTPGERFLIPEFGINLRKYLFQPVTQLVAEEIGRTILDAIQIWEPRVIVDHVSVVGLPFGQVISKNIANFTNMAQQLMKTIAQEDEYVVSIIISIPILKRTVNLEGVLTSNGFAELQT